MNIAALGVIPGSPGRAMAAGHSLTDQPPQGQLARDRQAGFQVGLFSFACQEEVAADDVDRADYGTSLPLIGRPFLIMGSAPRHPNCANGLPHTNLHIRRPQALHPASMCVDDTPGTALERRLTLTAFQDRRESLLNNNWMPPVPRPLTPGSRR